MLPIISSYTRSLPSYISEVKCSISELFQASTGSFIESLKGTAASSSRALFQMIIQNQEDSTVKKTGKTAICLLLSGVLFGSFSLQAKEGSLSFVHSSTPMILSPIEGKIWVEQCVQQYPEILWLANSEVRKNEKGQLTLQGTYSEQLFGQKYVEFDHTIMTLHCLKLILDGSEKAYAMFTAAQPENSKFSYKSFQTFHLQGKNVLKSRWGGMSELQMAQVMETALVLGNIGKSETARAVFNPYGIKAPDHDDFYGEAMQVLLQNPQLYPSFAKLPISAKELFAKIGSLAPYGHVTHLEGGLGMFSTLEESGVASTDPIALSFALFVHTKYSSEL